MDDLEILLSFLCSERQRLESKYREAEDQLKSDPDCFYFANFLRAKFRYQYFCDLERSLDRLLHLYD